MNRTGTSFYSPGADVLGGGTDNPGSERTTEQCYVLCRQMRREGDSRYWRVLNRRKARDSLTEQLLE